MNNSNAEIWLCVLKVPLFMQDEPSAVNLKLKFKYFFYIEPRYISTLYTMSLNKYYFSHPS